jgi:spore coat polysaccharide biosynthesis predicted glycosyltransferase SpsG
MTHNLSPTVYVRVSTDPAAGGGHLSRMLALRHALKGSIRWFVDPGTKSEIKERFSKTDEVFEEATIDSIVKLQSIIGADTDSLIICDSYKVRYEEIAAANVPAVYFYDSDVRSSSDNVVIVNCQPRAKACKNCLSGPGFMPVDTKGKQQVRADFACVSYPINCLIGFGTVDSSNMTAVALKALLSDQRLKESVQPVCLLGPHFQQREIVETLLSAFSRSKIIKNCQSVLELPFPCDIAIGAPGVSHAERLYKGIPTVLVPQSESHRALCMNWHDEGCALFARPEPKHIVSQINALIADKFDRARAISREGQRIIDGKGASRIVAELALRGQSI